MPRAGMAPTKGPSSDQQPDEPQPGTVAPDDPQAALGRIQDPEDGMPEPDLDEPAQAAQDAALARQIRADEITTEVLHEDMTARAFTHSGGRCGCRYVVTKVLEALDL